jgi:c-di-GMP-related signal transduction protein
MPSTADPQYRASSVPGILTSTDAHASRWPVDVTRVMDERVTRAVHVGRQAIYDRSGDVVAYELLFRDAPDALHAATRGSYATGQVIVAAFTEFGIRELVGDRACFVNLTREFLVGDLPLPFDPGQAGLEILADVEVDAAVLAGVADLAAQGYTITVDEFIAGQDREALLAYASYAKIDMLNATRAEVECAIERCRQHPHVQLIAQRLATEDLLASALELGFELFQGNVLGRPHLVTTHVLNPGRIHRLRLLTELSGDDVDLDRAVATIERDPALALRILQSVNAAANGLARQVSSVFEAVILVGTAQVRRWATLMLVVDLSDGNEAQLTEAVIRARMCQTLAEHLGQPGHAAFTVGLLSAVGDLLGVPAAELTTNLPLNDDVADAVVHGRGELGEILAAVCSYQNEAAANASGPDLAAHLFAAMRWSTASLDAASRPDVAIRQSI